MFREPLAAMNRLVRERTATQTATVTVIARRCEPWVISAATRPAGVAQRLKWR